MVVAARSHNCSATLGISSGYARCLLDILHNFLTMALNVATATSISSNVFILLREKRTEDLARCGSRPMFFNTREGSRAPELQAEPWLIAIPARSAYIRSVSQSTPKKAILLVFGTLGPSPLITLLGSARRPVSNLSWSF